MRWFRKKQVPAGPVRDPLAAVPMVARETESGVDNIGLIQVRRSYKPKKGLASIAARLFGQRFIREVRLDKYGSFFWSKIDGKRDLAEIAGLLAKEFDLEPKPAKQAVVKFTALLMRRDLIVLKIGS